MNIGDLFITIVTKGTDKVVGQLAETKGAMSRLADTSLETKAAIVGVFYGLEQLMSASAKLGTSLSTFATLTGESAQTLQKWEYAGAGASVTVDEMTSSIKNAKNAITQMQMTGEGPSIFFWLMKSTKLEEKKINDTFYLMGKLQEMASYVSKGLINPAQFTALSRQLGIADNLSAAFIKQKFTKKALAETPVLSEQDLKNLTAADAAWMQILYSLKVGMGRLVGTHGLPIMEDLKKLLPSIDAVVKSFSNMIEKSHALALLGMVFEGWGKIFDGIAMAAGAMNDALDNTKKTDEAKDKSGMWYWFKQKVGGALEWRDDMEDSIINKFAGKNYGAAVRPRVQIDAAGHTAPQYTVNQSNTFQWDGGADPNVTIDATRKGVHQAVKGFVQPHSVRKKP